MRPAYDYGDEVRVTRNVRNDGTFPGLPSGALLVRRGSTGYVVNVGAFLQDQIIYSVHFLELDRMVGCREEELIRGDAPWTPSRFESREKVEAARQLVVRGEMRAAPGSVGEVLRVLRNDADEVLYEVIFPGHVLCVPESALRPLSCAAGEAQA